MTTRIRPATWEECQAKKPNMTKSGEIPWPPKNEFWIITEGSLAWLGKVNQVGDIVRVMDMPAPLAQAVLAPGHPVQVDDGIVEPFSGQARVCAVVYLLL